VQIYEPIARHIGVTGSGGMREPACDLSQQIDQVDGCQARTVPTWIQVNATVLAVDAAPALIRVGRRPLRKPAAYSW
jgi:hypothetical protein